MRRNTATLSLLIAVLAGCDADVSDRRSALRTPCVHYGGEIRTDGIMEAYETPVRVSDEMLADMLRQIPEAKLMPGDVCVYLRAHGSVEVVPNQGVGYTGHWFKLNQGKWLFEKSAATGWTE